MTASAVASRSSPPIQCTYVPVRLSSTPSRRPPTTAPTRRVHPAEHGGGERVEQDASASCSARGRATAPPSRPRPRRARRRAPSPRRASRATRTPTSRASTGLTAAARRPRPAFVRVNSRPTSDDDDHRDGDHADVLLRERDAADVDRRRRERAGELLRGAAPDPGRQPVDRDQEADRQDHDPDAAGFPAAAGSGPAGSRRRRANERISVAANAGQNDQPWSSSVQHTNADNVAISPCAKLITPRRAVDDHDREREQAVDAAAREPAHDLLQEVRHVSQARKSGSPATRNQVRCLVAKVRPPHRLVRAQVAASPPSTTRPVSSTNACFAAPSASVGVLLDDDDRRAALVHPPQRVEDLAHDRAAQDRATARRAAAAAASPSLRGRARASAARRPTGLLPAAGAARRAAGRTRTRARGRAATCRAVSRRRAAGCRAPTASRTCRAPPARARRRGAPSPPACGGRACCLRGSPPPSSSPCRRSPAASSSCRRRSRRGSRRSRRPRRSA